jgi:hypothetical protein
MHRQHQIGQQQVVLVLMSARLVYISEISRSAKVH